MTDTKALPDESDDALVAMLEKDFHPPPQIKNNKLSKDIYQQHIVLTKQFLTINEHTVYANQHKAELLSEMSDPEKRSREEILKKRKELVR